MDPTRLHILYKAPPSEVLEWDDTSIVGMQRWLAKVLKLSQSTPKITEPLPLIKDMSKEEKELYRITNQTIKQVTDNMSTTYSFNTVISDLIKLSNSISASPITTSLPVYGHAVQSLVKMMAPMVPSTSEECWEYVGNQENSVFQQAWPSFHAEALEKDDLTCVIQVRSFTNLPTRVFFTDFYINRLMERQG